MRPFNVLFPYALLLVFFLTSCLTTGKKPGGEIASTSQAAGFNQAQGKADEAAGTADAKMQEQAGKLKANVNAAKREVDAMQPSNGQIIASGELGLAQKRLDQVKEDELEQEAAKHRKNLVESGKLQEAKDAYKLAEDRAVKLAQELGEARAAADQARRERDEQKIKFLQQLEDNRKANEKAMQDLKDSVMRDQVRNLNYAAAACLALCIGVFGVGAFFGGVASITKLGPLGALFGCAALLCFGLAQLVGQWWFKWACAGAIAIVVTWVIVWAIKHYKQGDLKTQAEAKVSNLHNTLQKVVPVLDESWDKASAEVKEFITQNIFGRLSNLMDSDQKKTIHEIRASLKQ